jgi:anti-sigma regulatory factor (Ser/Thr protein kinase)
VRNGETDRTEFARLEAAAHPGALRGLRREIRRFLAPLPLGSDRCDEVVLAVDEATANAVDHAYDPGKPGTVEVRSGLRPTRCASRCPITATGVSPPLPQPGAVGGSR